MFKKAMYVFLLALIVTFGCSPSSLANTERAQVNLEMGAHYAKSNIIELTEETEIYVTVRNEQESGSWLRFTVDLQKPFIVPEMPAMYLPEMVKDDWVNMGDKMSFPLTLKPGKYQLTLHSHEGNCKGSGTISPPSMGPLSEIELNHYQDNEKVYPIACAS